MAELEPGHPDELRDQLANWLAEATSPIGSLPANMPPTEWAARNFISVWRKPVRQALDSIDQSLAEAISAIRSGQSERAVNILDSARQFVGDDIRDLLGLYDWNREDDPMK